MIHDPYPCAANVFPLTQLLYIYRKQLNTCYSKETPFLSKNY